MHVFGELEAAIMDRLWARASPMTVREVLTGLQPERRPAYNTVLTVMNNLYKKQWLFREPDGRAFRYVPALTRAEYGARQLRQALDDAGDPDEALVRFVARMSPVEATALRRALDAHERDDQR